MTKAAIDIGSNSILLTVLDDDGAIVHDEARVVGLGRGLGDRGVFQPDRMRDAATVLREYIAIAGKHGVSPWQIRAAGTSACRRAMNAQTWVDHIKRGLGLQIRIVTGEEESRLSWLGAQRDLDLPLGVVLVIDLGGGSTELVLGSRSLVSNHTSLEIGSVRLTEEFLPDGTADAEALLRLRRWVQVAVERFRFEPDPHAVVGVAGSVTTLATMVLGLQTYESARIHGSTLTRADLMSIVERLMPATPEQRRALVPAAPDRAPYLLAAAIVLDEVLAHAGHDELLVSDRGLRFGLLAL